MTAATFIQAIVPIFEILNVSTNLTGYTITSLIDIVRLLLPLQASILLTALYKLYCCRRLGIKYLSQK